MNFNLDSIGAILISALVAGEQDAAVAFLQTVFEKDADLYKALVFVANYGLKKAADAATTTTTKLDDEAVAAIKGILVASATKNGLTI